MTAFIQAAHTSSGSNLPVTRIVIHGTVSPCQPGNARAVAGYFTSSGSGGSAHYVVDPTEIVQCVQENVIAWHAPPNAHSLGVELSDPQTGDGARWGDANHDAMLRLAAGLVRDLATKYGVPVVKLSSADLLAGKQGICGHADVSAAWHQTDHTDPGPDFPWDRFLSYVTGSGAASGIPSIFTNTTTASPGDDMPFTENDIARIVTMALRAEGVSGAADWNEGQYPSGSYTVGSKAAKIVQEEVTKALRAEGVSGAADGAARVLAKLADPVAIAAAVPADLAKQVADELAKRLAN